MRSAPPRSARATAAGWWVLGLLAALTLGRAATAPRERWPGLVGDEATYLMQAESLAWDGDLRFAPEDLARFRERRGQSPEVILQSGDGGGRIVYGKPFLYAAAIAPWVRVGGERGALMANALVLTAAGWLAALALVRDGVRFGPLWVAVALFASVAFGHVYWIHPDLFLMAAAASGLALAHLLRASPRVRSPALASLGWCAAGGLLALPGVWRPPYLVLLATGAFLAVVEPVGARERHPREPRSSSAPSGAIASSSGGGRRLALLLGGAVAVMAIAVGGQELITGNWSPYAGERRGFSELEGFPGVDFPAAEWSERVATKGNTAWLVDGKVEASVEPTLLGWNLLYLFAGRTVGLVPYFLPVIAALLRRRAGAAARVEQLAGLAAALAFVIVTPFNFYGGAGALANRYFLPVFPLFWFAGAGLARCAATALLAAPFLMPLWLAPAAYPILPGEGYRYVSSAARRLLPVETTQRNVKAPGRPDVLVGDLWVRFLDAGAGVPPQATGSPVPSGDVLVLHGSGPAELLVGRASPIPGLAFESVGERALPVRVSGTGTSSVDRGSSSAAIRFTRATARHPMWWTGDPFWIYRVTLESASPAVSATPDPATPIALRVRTLAAP